MFPVGRKAGRGNHNSGRKTKFEEITAAINNEAFIRAMIDARDKAIKRLDKITDEADYRALTDSIDKFTKNIQLLSGGFTDNVNYNETSYVNARKIIRDRKGSDTGDMQE